MFTPPFLVYESIFQWLVRLVLEVLSFESLGIWIFETSSFFTVITEKKRKKKSYLEKVEVLSLLSVQIENLSK